MWSFLLLVLPLLTAGIKYTRNTSPLVRLNRCLMMPDIPPRTRHLFEAILYRRYEGWAIKIGSNFKKQHMYKCKHIPYHEMSIYSRIGLLNAIRRYQPTKDTALFHLYAVHHIRGQLYKGMTDLSPITNVSKKMLRNAGTIYQRAHHHSGLLNNQHSGLLNNQPHTSAAHTNDSAKLWEHIEETAEPFTRRCITYKFDYDFNTIRSNREVAYVMSCSEETVRKNILNYFVNQHLGIILVKSTRPDPAATSTP